MLARQIIAKSCSLRRLVCRSNMAVSGCSSKNSFFAVIVAIVIVATSSSDPPATCSSTEVMEGETGVIMLSFSQDIQFRVEHGVFFSLRRGDDPLILVCSWMDEHSEKECKVENSARGTFHSNGLVDHKVTLVIPNVTLDLQGTYILTGHVNGSQVPPVNCNLTVLRTENATQAKFVTEDSSEVVSIVAPVLVVMVVINIIVLVILFWHRESVRNCVYRKKEASWSDETETMTESEQSSRTESR